MPKVLIIRFSSIGDIVLTSPVVRCLKNQQPDWELHFLTKKSFSSLLEHHPQIDRVITFDPKTERLSKLVQQLQTENYDYLIDLHKNLRTAYLKWRLKVKSYSFSKLNVQKWLLTNFKINRLPEVHIVDRYLKAVADLGITNDQQGLDYYLPHSSSTHKSTNEAIQQLPKDFIALVIGAKHATKRLPTEKLQLLCLALADYTIVLIGGPDDRMAAQQIASVGDFIHNYCGELNFHESAELIQAARVVVAHDTGFMHIAAALKKRIVSIWGNTIPEFGMTPYLPAEHSPASIIEVKDLACRPCSKIGYPECPKGHFACMQRININAIVLAVQQQW